MDEDVIDVARAIRPYLPELVGAEAAAYDREIADLTAEAHGGRDVGDQLAALLTRSAARNCRHVGDARRGAGPSPAAARIRRTVPSPTRCPKPSSSPWMRR